MYDTLRDFVRALDQAGELADIAEPVCPVLDIAAAADRASKTPAPRLPSPSARSADPRFHHLGGPALFFSRVEGSDFPLLINAWGSYKRMEMALGCQSGGFAQIADRIVALVKPEPPRSLREAWAKLRQFLPLLRIPPRRLRGRGLCQQRIIPEDRVDLTRLPLIRCWPHDGDFAALGYPPGINDAVPDLGHPDLTPADWEARFRGRYITLAGIHTIHADDRDNLKPATHNIGMYRVQLLGRRALAMHWHMHHDGARHWRSWKRLGKPMPVAIALGGESVMPYAATAPLPPGISELLLAGFLQGRGIPMVRGVSVPLWVPANAEIVIEGYVSHEAGPIGWDPRDPHAGPLGPGAVFEGPFGDHTGFYSMPDRYPILRVTAVTHRDEPIFPATVVGPPPQEDYFLGKATERIFLPLLKTLIHDIEDYDLPIFGAFHNCAFVKIKKEYPFQARRVMHSVWGAGQMAWTKTVFVVDDDTDVHDHHAVLRAAARRCAPGRDVEAINGPLDILDHAAASLGAGLKIGFDCTRRLPGEHARAMFFAPAVTAIEPPDDATGHDDPTLLDDLRRIDGVLDAALPESLGRGWLFIRARKDRPRQGDWIAYHVAQLLAARARRPARVIVLGPDVDVQDTDAALFHWLAHTDFGRDARGIGRPADPALAVEIYDATPKRPGDEAHGLAVRPWPPALTHDHATAARAAEILARIR